MAQQLYTATALGKILNLSGVHVGRLAREGTLTRRPDGKYPTAAITQYIEALRERGRDRSKYAEQIAAEKVRKLRRENDVEEGLYAPVEVLEDAAEKLAAQMIPILEGLPLHLKRAWPEITGDQIQVVKTTVAECRNAIADMELDFDE
jgi:phage terminase Nu1 subunit (DNA packaging protein)